MGRPSPKSKLVKTLRRLQRERDPVLRSQLIEMGRKALLNWFAMGARNLLRRVLPVNKVTERFLQSHRQELSIIADKNADEGERKKAILKRGGAGFLGGTIIRHLFKWETQKKKKAPPKRRAARKVPPLRLKLPAAAAAPPVSPLQLPAKVPPLRLSLKKKKSPKQKLIVKYSFGKKKKSPQKKSPKKKSPKKKSPQKKSLMVKIPLEKLRNVTPEKKTKTLADLKMGLALKKMERAMRGPIGSSRTTDTATPIANVMPFTPLAASTPKKLTPKKLTPKSPSGNIYRCGVCDKDFSSMSNLTQHMNTRHIKGDKPKYVCTICGIQFNLMSSLERHIKTVHMGQWPPN